MADKPAGPRVALLVVDMLNDFLDTWPAKRRNQLCASTNELVRLIRDHRHPVVWVRQEFAPDLSDAFPEMRLKGIRTTIRGTPGCEIVPELEIAPADHVVTKKRYSAFFGTELDSLLKRLGSRALILAGINTHACVRTTAIDAYQRDFRVILAADCVDSYDREHHEISLRYMKERIGEIMTNQEIRSLLMSD